MLKILEHQTTIFAVKSCRLTCFSFSSIRTFSDFFCFGIWLFSLSVSRSTTFLVIVKFANTFFGFSASTLTSRLLFFSTSDSSSSSLVPEVSFCSSVSDSPSESVGTGEVLGANLAAFRFRRRSFFDGSDLFRVGGRVGPNELSRS